MHILFLTPYYPPEKTAAAIRISETAECLARRGYKVTVLTTFPNFPTGIIPPEYRGDVLRCEIANGVRVVRVWSYVTPNSGFLRRILAQLSFGCIAPFLGWKSVGRPDVIIAESPPLFDAIAARILARGKHCPYIFTIADLWPESAVQLGILHNSLMIRLAEWLEWTTYQSAGLVWSVTGDIRARLIQRGLAPEQVFLLTNGVDVEKFAPMPRKQARDVLGWDDRFTVVYAGTHGLAHGLMTVLDAAQYLRSNPEIHIVFVGDGSEKAGLQERARRENLHNVTFLDALQHDQMPLLLTAADVCLVPLRKIALFKGALPSKLYEIMACARPMLLAVDGEARRLIEQEAGAAIFVEPENAQALTEAIIRLYKHPELCSELGSRGRAFVETRFDREKLVEALEAQIARIGKQRAIIHEEKREVVAASADRKQN